MHREQLPIAQSCGEDWDAMRGNERRRRCEKCAHDVVNLSAMSEREARALIASQPKAATLCVRYRSGSDGRVRFRPERSAPLLRRAPSLAAAGLASMLAVSAPALADTTPPESPPATAPADGAPAPKPGKRPHNHKPKAPKRPDPRERDDMGMMIPPNF
jgi:hypothetical protein